MEAISLVQHVKQEQQLEVEQIWRLAVISDNGAAQPLIVELRDANSRNVPFTISSGGTKVGAASVQVSSAASILNLLKGAGYNTDTNGIPPNVVGDGPPVCIRVRLAESATGTVSYNLSGDPTGGSAATAGISTRYGAPVQNGCSFLKPGEWIQVGMGWGA